MKKLLLLLVMFTATANAEVTDTKTSYNVTCVDNNQHVIYEKTVLSAWFNGGVLSIYETGNPHTVMIANAICIVRKMSTKAN